jgi:putative transposase
MHTMTKEQVKAVPLDLKAVRKQIEADEDYVRPTLQAWFQAALEAEMSEAIGAEKGERTAGRLS